MPLTPVADKYALDDAIALILQLEPENVPELSQVFEMIQALAAARPEADSSYDHLNGALTVLGRIIQSSSNNPGEDLKEAMILLETARSAQEAQSDVIPAPAGYPEPACAEVPNQEDRPAKSAPAVVELPADADRELIGEFITESKDLLEGAEAALLSLETDPENMDSVNTVFRTFHTIKGTSGFLGLSHIQEFGHRAESLLSRVRDREIRYSGIYADLALRSADVLKDLLRGVQDMLAGQASPLPGGYDEVMRLLEAPEAAATNSRMSSNAPAHLEGKTESQVAVSTVSLEKVEQAAALGAAADNTVRTQRRVSSPDGRADSSLRVRTDRLDRLVDMVGELVIAQSMLSQDSTVHQGGNHDLLRKVTHAGKIVRELQDLAMSMRMVPLKGIFQKVARLVRDLAHKSGKSVQFVGEGEETEIDRNMVDVLSDPLVHMVRNAIDHGIEPPEVRAMRGKFKTGTIRLAAYHSGGNVVIELQDDGKGLDREKVVEKAIAKGLLESEKNLSDSEALHLIFLPGFSTSEKLTEISGRGVGMDVVRKGVEALRGRVDLASEPGKGCTFFVRLPLTLAITDGMLVKVGNERYIIPTINIHLSFRPERSALWSVAGRGEMVRLRGELMPVFRLHRLFNIKNAVSDPTSGLLVVVGEGGQRCALLVDELLGQQQVVAKSLGEGLTKCQGIAGGAILGDGRVGLILDTPVIPSLARQGTGAARMLRTPTISAA